MWNDASRLAGIKTEPILNIKNGNVPSKEELDKLLKKASWKIEGEKGTEREAIEKAYGITDIEAFRPQYKDAVEGTGKEDEKILTLHSSSRLSLLCFYKLYKETGKERKEKLVMNLDGEEVEFDCTVFEFQNPVIGYPSNMDVTLFNKEKKIILFLESKFSEYYIGAAKKSSPIGISYKNNEFSKCFYCKYWLKDIGLNIDHHVQEDEETKAKKESMVLSTIDGSEVYLDGFKQMISHYIGIRRRLRNNETDVLKGDEKLGENAKEILNILRNETSTVYLGEILYDKFMIPDGDKRLGPEKIRKDYSKLYKRLAERMNELIAEDQLSHRFKVLTNDLKYSEVMKDCSFLDDVTKTFYGLG